MNIIWKRIGTVAVFGVVVALGNLRSAVSEVAPTAASRPPIEIDRGASPAVVREHGAVEPSAVLQRVGTKVDDRSAVSKGPDDAQLVPALFARDPDVRVTYYRHISKWM